MVGRWALALVFALAGAAAGGASYARVTKPYAAELASVRSRVTFADFVEHRMLTMTPAERRQFDSLMKLSAAQQLGPNRDRRTSGKPTPQNPGNHDREQDSKQRK